MRISRRLSSFALALWIIVVATLFLPTLVVSRDLALICENTGSRKGYREWFWVVKKDRWYKQSSLETFIRQRYPAEFRHRWISYKGDNYNIAGIPGGHAHGNPVMGLAIETIDAYVAKVNDTKKKELYDCFAKGNYEAVKAKMNEVSSVVLDEAAVQQ